MIAQQVVLCILFIVILMFRGRAAKAVISGYSGGETYAHNHYDWDGLRLWKSIQLKENLVLFYLFNTVNCIFGNLFFALNSDIYYILRVAVIFSFISWSHSSG